MKSTDFKVTESKLEAQRSCGGVTPKVIAVINEQKVLIKGGNYFEPLIEMFSYKFAETLGVRANKVGLIDCGEMFDLKPVCSVHWWEDRFQRALKSRKMTKEESETLNFFDDVIKNTDRHEENYGFVEDELFIIDNGYSHPWLPDLPNTRLFNYAFSASISPIVDKFLSLQPFDFRKMLELPENFNKNSWEFFIEYELKVEQIINRMKNIQGTILQYRSGS